MHGRRRKSRIQLRMFFEPATLVVLAVSALTWVLGIAVLTLLATGKWTHIAHWIARSPPS
jgi:hypothetical protein